MTLTIHQKSWLAKCLVALAIFILGLAIGYVYGHRMPRRPALAGRFGNNIQGMQTITIKNGSGTTTLNRDAGTVNKISGNVVTITDNANQQQQILSDNSTIIMGQLKEIGLSDLKIGQRISVDGTMNSSGQLEARTIVTR